MLLDNSRKLADIHGQLFLLRFMVFNRTHQDGIVKKKGLIKQLCPGLNANEMHVLHDRHHKVSSLIKGYQNTPNYVKYEVIWKCHITHKQA